MALPLLMLRLWPTGHMIQPSFSSREGLALSQSQTKPGIQWLAAGLFIYRPDLRDDAKLLAHQIYYISGFLFLVVNSTLLDSAVQAEYKKNLVFIMNFNRPVKERAAALEICICSFSYKVLRFQRSSTWPLEGSLLEMMSRKLLTPWQILFECWKQSQRDAVSSEKRLQKMRPFLDCCVIFHHVFSRGSNVII